MTGIDLLRWSQEGVVVKLHTSALDFLIETYPTLCRKEVSASILLAHAMDFFEAQSDQIGVLRRSRYRQDGRPQGMKSERVGAGNQPSNGRNFWLTLWTTSGTELRPGDLRLAVSCLSWTLGNYPVFLWSPDLPSPAPEVQLRERFRALQRALLDVVHPQRVFSVFGRADLVKVFSETWSLMTCIAEEPGPFYEAVLSYCTRESFKQFSRRPPGDGRVRKAQFVDLGSVAILCKEFADTSVYFPLFLEEGKQEARWLIEKGVVWLYETGEQAVSICAVARQSDDVAVVTKVYTTPKWRRKGFAEALVRKVTEEMLVTKQHVALYVGINNDAQHIYDRIGFIGLCGKDRPIDVEDVLEIGFRGTDRGHW